jgi:hypothetical protein
MNTGDYNRYAYVNSNPMTFTDPTGFIDELEEVEVNGKRASFEADFSFMDSGGWGWDGFDFGGRELPDNTLDSLTEVPVTAVSCEADPSQADCAAAAAAPGWVFNYIVHPGLGHIECALFSGTDYQCGIVGGLKSTAIALSPALGGAAAEIAAPVIASGLRETIIGVGLATGIAPTAEIAATFMEVAPTFIEKMATKAGVEGAKLLDKMLKFADLLD